MPARRGTASSRKILPPPVCIGTLCVELTFRGRFHSSWRNRATSRTSALPIAANATGGQLQARHEPRRQGAQAPNKEMLDGNARQSYPATGDSKNGPSGGSQSLPHSSDSI